MTRLRVGSLFSGYGGLEVGIAQVLDSETAWHSEIEPGPCRVLEHHWPDVPNLGDVTAVDWALVAEVAPVEILCGGLPCQDVSLAGLRRGLKPGTRSGLWSHFAAAIDALRPELVVIENVRGLLSAEAHSDLEPDAWDLGGPERLDRPALRALGAVLGDLADLGYDAEWIGVRAADAGAPHGRFRVFVIAHAADAGGEARRLGTGLRTSEPRGLGGRRPDDDRVPAAAPDADRAADGQPAGGTGRSGGVGGVEAGPGRARYSDGAGSAPDSAAERGHPAPDADGGDRLEEHAGDDALDGERAALGRQAVEPARPGRDGVAPERDQAAAPAARRGPAAGLASPGRGAAPDALGDDGERPGGSGRVARALGVPREPDGSASDAGRDAPRDLGEAPRAWGPFAPAIRRWEAALGRVAPAPTETGPGGGDRLSPRFVEWMMGLEAGHVTAPEIGLTRRQQLKALGNGVVPQQAALALRTLLS